MIVERGAWCCCWCNDGDGTSAWTRRPFRFLPLVISSSSLCSSNKDRFAPSPWWNYLLLLFVLRYDRNEGDDDEDNDMTTMMTTTMMTMMAVMTLRRWCMQAHVFTRHNTYEHAYPLVYKHTRIHWYRAYLEQTKTIVTSRFQQQCKHQDVGATVFAAWTCQTETVKNRQRQQRQSYQRACATRVRASESLNQESTTSTMTELSASMRRQGKNFGVV